MRPYLTLALLFFTGTLLSQQPANATKDSTDIRKESPFKTGFYTVGFFDIDLKYPIKLNNYESFRFGFGGVTNDKLVDGFKLGGYVAYGTKDKDWKYSVGGEVRLTKTNNTWINLYYINDITEIGSFSYLTDARVYSLFEPRLVNITQFYKHRTWKSSLVNEFGSNILTELKLSRTKLDQIEAYQFVVNGTEYTNYRLSEATASIRLGSNQRTVNTTDGRMLFYDSFPVISAQITQGVKGVVKSDFNYTKIGAKLDYTYKSYSSSSTNLLLEGNIAFGDVPLTHLFHAYPNGPTKDEILQRFSVAGIQSFETMYFGEFFSSELVTFHAKHTLPPFKFSDKFKPEIVLLSRHALGDIENPERHQIIEFDTLNQLYNEAGIEINKLAFGFGLSFAYRYGGYHLDDFEDNVSFKFTFNLKI